MNLISANHLFHYHLDRAGLQSYIDAHVRCLNFAFTPSLPPILIRLPLSATSFARSAICTPRACLACCQILKMVNFVLNLLVYPTSERLGASPFGPGLLE